MQQFFLLFAQPLDMIIVNATCAASGSIPQGLECLSRSFLTVYDLHSALDEAGLPPSTATQILERLEASGRSFVEVDREACAKLGLLREAREGN